MADGTSRGLCVCHSFPLQWADFAGGGGGGRSFQVVWRTVSKVDLKRTKNYCVELLAIYLRRMII